MESCGGVDTVTHIHSKKKTNKQTKSVNLIFKRTKMYLQTLLILFIKKKKVSKMLKTVVDLKKLDFDVCEVRIN